MQLMQWNWFLDRGVLRFDPRRPDGSAIDYRTLSPRGRRAAARGAGDPGPRRPAAADAFITRWSRWDEALHGRVAATMRAQQRYRYRLFTYAALGE